MEPTSTQFSTVFNLREGPGVEIELFGQRQFRNPSIDEAENYAER